MPEGLDYESAAKLADDIDRSSQSVSESVDVAEVLAEELKVERLSYSEVSRSLLKEAYAEQATEAKQREPAPAPPAAKPELQAERVRAASRLREAAGKIGSEFGGIMAERKEEAEEREEKAEEKRLIMPRLSLQDQVSDLGKIQEGLDEGVFSEDQIAIIKEELHWLSGPAARISAANARDEQGELLAIRDQKAKAIEERLAAA